MELLDDREETRDRRAHAAKTAASYARIGQVGRRAVRGAADDIVVLALDAQAGAGRSRAGVNFIAAIKLNS